MISATYSNAIKMMRSVDKHQRRHVSVWQTVGMKRRRSSSRRSAILVLSTTLLVATTVLTFFRLLPSIQERAWHYTLQLAVPTCPSTPWKSKENLRGKCILNPYYALIATTTITECATSCCKDDNCITWQFRHDVGCFHGADLRLGMEKDGPAAWCSDHKSYIWHGQNLVWKGDASRQLACNEHTWNPNEQSGQCLGLGDVRLESSKTARDCMHACCDDETCNSWQWNEIVSVYFIIIFMQQLCILFSCIIYSSFFIIICFQYILFFT